MNIWGAAGGDSSFDGFHTSGFGGGLWFLPKEHRRCTGPVAGQRAFLVRSHVALASVALTSSLFSSTLYQLAPTICPSSRILRGPPTVSCMLPPDIFELCFTLRAGLESRRL